jgi:replication factor A1
MTISELNAGQGNVNVEGTITEVGEGRTFSKFGKEMTVANAILQDDSGSIKLTLWNEDASKYKEGDKIKIENGYVNEFQGENQLTAGKFGKMEKVGEGEASADAGQEKLSDDAPAEESAKDDAEKASDEKPAEEETVI